MTIKSWDQKRRHELLDKMRMFKGAAPHGAMNPCYGDGYFYNSLRGQYFADDLAEAAAIVDEEQRRVREFAAAVLKETP